MAVQQDQAVQEVVVGKTTESSPMFSSSPSKSGPSHDVNNKIDSPDSSSTATSRSGRPDNSSVLPLQLPPRLDFGAWFRRLRRYVVRINMSYVQRGNGTRRQGVCVWGGGAVRCQRAATRCSSELRRDVPTSWGEEGAATRSVPTDALPRLYSPRSRILSIPSFCVLVLQGVTGGTPWMAMSFLNMYWLTLGFPASTAASIIALTKTGGILGAYFGGWFGDFAARRSPVGRVMVAQLSVALGMPLWHSLLNPAIVDGSSMFPPVILGFLFFLCGTWTMAGANRPICAELVTNSADRAQIVGLWITIEGALGAVVGPTVVGAVSEMYGYKLETGAGGVHGGGGTTTSSMDHGGAAGAKGGSSLAGMVLSRTSGPDSGMEIVAGTVFGRAGLPDPGHLLVGRGVSSLMDAEEPQSERNAHALGRALSGLGVVCWSLCFLFWCLMYRTYPRDRERAAAKAHFERVAEDAEQFEFGFGEGTAREGPSRSPRIWKGVE